MKKAIIWIFMCIVAVVCIPLSWMLETGMAFNQVINAFFNGSNTTLAFFYMQLFLMVVITEIMLYCMDHHEVKPLQFTMLFLILAAIFTKGYLYYAILAAIAFIFYLYINKERNKLKDDLTTTLEEVRDSYQD